VLQLFPFVFQILNLLHLQHHVAFLNLKLSVGHLLHVLWTVSMARHFQDLILDFGHLVKLGNNICVGSLQTIALLFELDVLVPENVVLLPILTSGHLTILTDEVQVLQLVIPDLKYLVCVVEGLVAILDADISCKPQADGLLPRPLLCVHDLGEVGSVAI
jgi:hypothetical protein